MRSGLPSGVRGISLRTKAGHCAFIVVAIAAVKAHARRKRRILLALPHESLRAAVVDDLRRIEIAFRVGCHVMNDVKLAGT